MQLLAGGRVPEAGAAIVASRGQETAIGREAQPEDSILVASQAADLFSGGRIPQANGPVPATRCQEPAVGRQSQAIDGGGMPLREGMLVLAGGRLCGQCPLEAGPSRRSGWRPEGRKPSRSPLWS